MNKTLPLFFLFLGLVGLACKTLGEPVSTVTPPPSATPKPSATRTATVLPPTSTPTITPTLSPVGEFQFGERVALDFLRTDWRADGVALVSLQHPGCAVLAADGVDFPGAGLPETQIGGYGWVNAQGLYLLKIGEQVYGAVRVDYGEKPTACRKSAEMLLKSLHAVRAYAEAGRCEAAPKQQLAVGESAAVKVSSYLRSAPRWAEETRIRLLAPGETLKVTGGPVCGLYNRGEYRYWQVELATGETGWLADGDANGDYLAPKE